MNLALLVAADERMCFVAILDFHGNHDGPDQRSSPRELFLRPLLQYISVPGLTKQQSSIWGRCDAAQSSVQDSAHSFGKQQHHPDIQISVERVKLAVSHALADTDRRTHTKFVQGPRHSVHKGVRLFTCLPNVVQRATSRGSPRILPGM